MKTIRVLAVALLTLGTGLVSASFAYRDSSSVAVEKVQDFKIIIKNDKYDEVYIFHKDGTDFIEYKGGTAHIYVGEGETIKYGFSNNKSDAEVLLETTSSMEGETLNISDYI